MKQDTENNTVSQVEVVKRLATSAPQHVATRIEQMAKSNRRSVSAEMLVALEAHIAANSTKADAA